MKKILIVLSLLISLNEIKAHTLEKMQWYNEPEQLEAKVKITGAYKAGFDQMGLMIRTDQKNYVKAGVEFVDGKLT